MSVAREISEHLLWAFERSLRIDHPLSSTQRCESRPKLRHILDRRQLIEEPKLAVCVQTLEAFEKEPPEQPREHAHGEEEVVSARHPSCAARTGAATRHDAMHMWMMIEVLTPRVQH